jgi:hypothetical protein
MECDVSKPVFSIQAQLWTTGMRGKIKPGRLLCDYASKDTIAPWPLEFPSLACPESNVTVNP